MSEYDFVGTGASDNGASDWCAHARRGQVNFDFAVGASIFIFAIVFAFSIAPGIFASPATDSQQSNELRAERAAGWITDDERVVNTYCLAKLLDKSTPTDCGFSSDSTVAEKLPIDGPVNVSASRNASGGNNAKLYWDGTEIVQSSSDSLFAAGTPYTSAENVGVARRTVTLGGNETTITVRAW